VGRLHPLKGASDLIDATVTLSRSAPGVRTVLAGPGTESEVATLRRQIARVGADEAVRMLGPVDESTKIRLIDAADVVVVPSRSDFVEGFSLVSSEAWARGKPVAAYPVGALRCRVKEGTNGALATSFDTGALAEAILRALDIRSVSAPADVVAWPEVVGQFEDLYGGLLSGTRAQPSGA
jgi:glycosyltransferase involved in cell wall biosynthesis